MTQDPDKLLNIVQRQEDRGGKGHLKIFLGMAAGVGKTCAMLQRAHQARAQGIDVVVGWVDTHGRDETQKLVEGLDVFPRLTITHHGAQLEEMDVTGLIKRKPQLVIVDELAHNNAPTSRHAKRYLDVIELVDAGIDVFTAVNVQHLESRYDVVHSITGVRVQETVPDTVLDRADEIILIDLPPEELLERLKSGKIYPRERAELAARNFFKPGNLTALRELALRTAAGRVDRELRDFKTLHGIDAAWKSSSRYMVGIFGSPYSEFLIRWTRQLADTTGGTWLGVYVETGAILTDDERSLMEKNAALVRQLGGEFATISDSDLVSGLLKIARQNHVTQIVVGKTLRSSWQNWLRGGSIVQKLLRRSGDIDVYAIATEKTSARVRVRRPTSISAEWFPWGEAGWVTATVFGFWFFASLLAPTIGYESIGIIFLMAVLTAGLFLSRISVFLIAILLSLIHNFFFIPPLYTLAISRPQDILMHAMFLLAAASIGHLTTRLRRQNRIIQEREDRAVLLFNLARAVSETLSIDEVVKVGVRTLAEVFSADVSIIFFGDNGKPDVQKHGTYLPDDKELAVAEWVRQHGAPAGRFTAVLSAARATYLPLLSRKVTVGVVAVQIGESCLLDYDQKDLAQALCGQIAIGLDRERSHQSRQRLEVLEQGDRLFRTLFDSVSHELKTPLTTIRGATSLLAQNPDSQQMLRQVESETDRLLKIVDNMLDMTRLESGSLKPRLQLCDIADIVGPALKRVEKEIGLRKIDVHVADGVSAVKCDGPLTVQSLSNILHNAMTYTESTGHIALDVRNSDDRRWVEIRVSDRGPGLPKDNPGQVFDRFYRANPERSGGLGLGLSIARGFIECQGGRVSAANRVGGGATFCLELPTV